MKLPMCARKTYLRVYTCLALGAVLFSGCKTPSATVQPDHPQVLIQTTLGAITVEVYEKAAPITAANFLRYVDEGAFEGASFYRSVTMDNQPNNEVKIEVIQGGLGATPGGNERMHAPIPHETTQQTGILHKDGALSMARSAPGTVTTEFFICIGDQPSLDFGGARNPDGQGFAALGQVIDGMNVVRQIQQQPTEGQRLSPVVEIINITRVE